MKKESKAQTKSTKKQDENVASPSFYRKTGYEDKTWYVNKIVTPKESFMMKMTLRHVSKKVKNFMSKIAQMTIKIVQNSVIARKEKDSNLSMKKSNPTTQ